MKETTVVHCNTCHNVHNANECPSTKVVNKFFSVLEENIEISELTDKQLANIVLEKIWAECPVQSTEAAVLSSVIDRLNRANAGPINLGVTDEPS